MKTHCREGRGRGRGGKKKKKIYIYIYIYIYIRSTPLQQDPKQQELRTHRRPRLDLRLYEGLFEGIV